MEARITRMAMPSEKQLEEDGKVIHRQHIVEDGLGSAVPQADRKAGRNQQADNADRRQPAFALDEQVEQDYQHGKSDQANFRCK